MEDKKHDEELTRQMLDWLSRGMDLNGDFPLAEAPVELELSEEDFLFLREQHIAII